jgi:hypothetical protein
VADVDERLRVALRDLYAFYARTERMMFNVLRDEETMPIVKEMLTVYRRFLDGAREILMKDGKLKECKFESLSGNISAIFGALCPTQLPPGFPAPSLRGMRCGWVESTTSKTLRSRGS